MNGNIYDFWELLEKQNFSDLHRTLQNRKRLVQYKCAASIKKRL